MRHRRHRDDFDVLGMAEPRRRFGVTATLIALAATEAAGSYAAAKTQSNAAQNAAQIQAGGTQKALDFAKQMWGQSQQAQSPYLNAGGAAANQLNALLTPPGSPGAYRPGMSFAPPPPNGGMIPGRPMMSPGGVPVPGGMPQQPPPNPWAVTRPMGPQPSGY